MNLKPWIEPDSDQRHSEETEATSEAKVFTPKNIKLAKSSGEIYMNPGKISDSEYIHSVLCQVGLPRKEPYLMDANNKKILGEDGKPILATEFERKSGNASLLIKAGEYWDGREWVKQPIPYGSVPRLAFVHICSEAVRKQEPVIQIGENLSDFMDSLDIAHSGGKNGRFNAVKKQIRALSVCELKLGVSYTDETRSIIINPIQEFRAWVANKDEEIVLWPKQITLSDNFFESLMIHSVPLDYRALHELKDSSLALDIYFWLAHRLHRSKAQGELIPWTALRKQFGQEYNKLYHFKEEFYQKLIQALSQYPTANVELDPVQGLIVRESPTPIPKKDYYPFQPKKIKSNR